MNIGSLTGSITLEDQVTDVLNQVNSALTTVGATAAEQAKHTSAFASSMVQAGADLTDSFTTPLLAVGQAAITAGLETQAAMGTIAKSTGATGDELKALGESFRAVFVQVPNSAQEVAVALSDVSKRFAELNLTSSQLEGLTAKFITFANVNKIDVADATKTVTTMLNAMHIPLDQAQATMDKLTFASQRSGVSVEKLSDNVSKNGYALKEMGFSLDQSIALFTNLDKAGASAADVSRTLGGVLKQAVKDGATDASSAFRDMVTNIKNAESPIKATELAQDAFGKATGRVVAAIRSGAFDVDAFAGSLSKVGEATAQADKNASTFGEQMVLIKKKITMAWEPLGTELLKTFDRVKPVIDGIVTTFTNLVKSFSDLPQPMKDIVIGVGLFLTAIGPVVTAVSALAMGFGALTTMFAEGTVASTALGGAITFLTGPIGLAIAGFTALVGVLAYFDLLEPIINWFKELGNTIVSVVVRAMKWLEEAIISVSQNGFVQLIFQVGRLLALGIVEAIMNQWNAFKLLVTGVMNVAEWFVNLVNYAGGVISSFTGMSTGSNVFVNALKTLVDWAVKAFTITSEWAGWLASALSKIGKDPGLPAVTTNLNSYTEALKPAVSHSNDLAVAQTTVGASAATMTKAQKDLAAASVVLTDAQKEDIEAMNAKHISLTTIAKDLHLSVTAVKNYINEIKSGQKEQTKFNTALDKFNGLTEIKAAESLAAQIEQLGGPLKVAPDQVKKLSDQLMAASKAATTLGNTGLATKFSDLAKAINPVLAAQEQFKGSFDKINVVIPTTTDFLWDLNQAIEAANGNTILISNSFGELLNSSMNLSKAFEPFKAVVKDSKASATVVKKDWTDSVNSMASTFADMFSGINSEWGQMAKVAASAFKVMTTEGKTTADKIGAAFGAASEIVGQLWGDTKGGGIASGALGGAAAGMAFGPIGAGIGAAAGALLGWVSASKKAKEENQKANASLEDLRGGLLKTYGSLENLNSISERLFNMNFVAEWGHQGTQGLKQFQAFVDDFNDRMKQVGEATNKIVTGFSAVSNEMTRPWIELGTQIDEAHKKTEDAYKAAADYAGGSAEELNKLIAVYGEALTAEQALNDQRTATAEQAKQALEDLGTAAIATFSSVYVATGSYSEALKAAQPQLMNLVDSYKALGIESDNVLLKNMMIQSQVMESSPQLITAIDGQAMAMQGMAQMGLLNADTFASMQRTAIELYTRLQGETVNAAAAQGDLGDQSKNALLPMQAYLQQATKQAELLGLPLDENTQRLIDQSKELGIWQEAGVTAQDKLIKGMDGIVTKLDELLNQLFTMTSTLTNMPDAHSTVTIDHVDTYKSIYYPDEQAGESQNKAGGGVIVQNYATGTPFVPHGSDTVPAMLTPGERVLTTQENKEYTSKQDQAMNTEKLERTLDGIRQDLRRNNDTLLISLQSMLEHAMA